MFYAGTNQMIIDNQLCGFVFRSDLISKIIKLRKLTSPHIDRKNNCLGGFIDSTEIMRSSVIIASTFAVVHFISKSKVRLVLVQTV